MDLIPREETSEDDLNVALIESGTKAGRPYTKRRWTLGDSTSLIEGTPRESPFVTAAWVGIPVALMVIVLSLMAQAG